MFGNPYKIFSGLTEAPGKSKAYWVAGHKWLANEVDFELELRRKNFTLTVSNWSSGLKEYLWQRRIRVPGEGLISVASGTAPSVNAAAKAALDSDVDCSTVIRFDGRDIMWFGQNLRDNDGKQVIKWETRIDGDECWVYEPHNGYNGHPKMFVWGRNLHSIFKIHNKHLQELYNLHVSGKERTLAKAFDALHSTPKNLVKKLRDAADVIELDCISKYPALSLEDGRHGKSTRL